MRYHGPKARRVRRQGFNLYGADKYDRILQRKPYPPGMQAAGSARRGKLSEYGKQLLEKQKACHIYGVMDRQLRAMYALASQRIGRTDAMMNELLERRLDSAVYRAGFASTRLQARQFVSHGLFTVDGTRVTIPSYRLRQGQRVAVRIQRKTSPVFLPILAAHEKYISPDWLRPDPANLAFDVLALPSKEEHFERGLDMRKVIGFYSR